MQNLIDKSLQLVLTKSLQHFADQYDYDVSYLFEMNEQAPGTLLRYMLMTPLSQYRRAASPAAYYVAKLVAVKAYDCGPCLRLVCNMATAEEVPLAILIATIQDRYEALPDDLALVARYSRAVVTQDNSQLAAMQHSVIDQWGEAALAEIALAIAFGGFYPTLKRGLGHASSCAPIIAELNTATA